MKNIMVITLNRIVNYGSVLQTYALQEAIRQCGANAITIDYYPERMTMIGMLKRIKGKNKLLENPFFYSLARMLMIPSYIQRFRIFNSFNEKYINLTSKQFRCDQDFVNYTFEADAFCTGSDQTWNSDWNEGITLPFYLFFADKYKFSYAASFGKNSISTKEKEQIKGMLKGYKRISVRETSGIKILDDIGIDGVNVLDPTLLLTGEDWSKLCSEKSTKKDYILLYNLNRNKRLRTYAERVAKKTGLDLIYITYNLCDFYHSGTMACNVKVEDFLTLLKNASLVLTDSFHATAFSLNFERDFYIIYPSKFSTRLQSILEITGLENRVVEDFDDIVLSEHIDYSLVTPRLDKARNMSKLFLQDCISEI